jgi:predicted permease
MLAVLSLVTPVFGLIGLGLVAARVRLLDAAAARILSEFAFKIAMPALLFRAMAGITVPEASPFSLMGAYLTGVFTIWIAASIVTVAVLRRSATDAPAVAMASCFGNGVMLGIPLILGAFGEAAATPVAFIVSAETMLLWLIGTLHMEVSSRSWTGFSPVVIGGALRDVLINPIVLSIMVGLAWAASGLQLPGVVDKLIAILAHSAIPVALFALGMSLATFRVRGQVGTIGTTCALKLALYPALAFVLAHYVFKLPFVWASTLTLFTSMPVGANAFVFASRYEKAVNSISAAVAISTVIAVFSVSVVLGLLQMLGGGLRP